MHYLMNNFKALKHYYDYLMLIGILWMLMTVYMRKLNHSPLGFVLFLFYSFIGSSRMSKVVYYNKSYQTASTRTSISNVCEQ